MAVRKSTSGILMITNSNPVNVVALVDASKLQLMQEWQTVSA